MIHILSVYSLIIFVIALVPALRLFNTRYELTTERIFIYKGIINQVREEIELYRIRDYMVVRPVWLRILGKGNILIKTSDLTIPVYSFIGISNPYKVSDMLRNNVEQMRMLKGVREVDYVK